MIVIIVQQQNNATLLQIAISKQKLPTVKLLAADQALLFGRDNLGNYCVHTAAECAFIDGLHILLLLLFIFCIISMRVT